jgi:hypothetical protein
MPAVLEPQNRPLLIVLLVCALLYAGLLFWVLRRMLRARSDREAGTLHLANKNIVAFALGLTGFFGIMAVSIPTSRPLAGTAWIISAVVIAATAYLGRTSPASKALSCVRCNATVSSNAPECPHCRYPAAWNLSSCRVCQAVLPRNKHKFRQHIVTSGIAVSGANVHTTGSEHFPWAYSPCPNCGEPKPIA